MASTLVACGGGGSGGEPPAPAAASHLASTTASADSPQTRLLQSGEPSSGAIGPGEAAWSRAVPLPLGFYDVDATGAVRKLRNDLEQGSLAGEVQFVQSHSMAPAGNDAREMPTPVALREALLLLIGNDWPGGADEASSTLTVTASTGGSTLGKLRMQPPSLLPASDNSAPESRGRPAVGYSRRAWSVAVPWNWMRPGLQLAFAWTPASGPALAGTLPAGKVEFAAPAELVVQNIRLGMLTPPNTATGYLMDHPESAGTDYFQTVPIARLTVAQYEDMHLSRVIVGTGGGAIYDTASPQNGDVYSGDMRENVAKVQVAQGINLANFGLVDSDLTESQPESFSERTVIHSRGLYANGIQEHGLSGGNGMINLMDSVGNEFSHELGHSYGLGHYPGEGENAKNPVHHADSGWGYIASRQRMRGNLAWGEAFNPAGTQKYGGTFSGSFNYKADAMSGGEPDSALSAYTHHTGYSARRIQLYLNTARSGGPRAVPDLAFASGWRGWDAARGQWVDRVSQTPAFKAPRPVAVGVPVVTLLGGYQTQVPRLNLVYAGFNGNWGVTYDNPAPAASGSACWLEVALAQGAPLRIALQASATNEGPRKFHVNIARSRAPQSAALVCRDAQGVSTVLSRQAIAGPAKPLKPAIVIGEADGMSALRGAELAALDAFIRTRPANGGLPGRQQQMLLSWRDDLSGLSEASRAWALHWLATRDTAMALDAHVLANPGLLTAHPDQEARTRMHRYATALGIFNPAGLTPPVTGPLTFQRDRTCLDLDKPDAALPGLKTTPAQSCAKQPSQQWWSDAADHVHNEVRPDLCLTTDGGWYSAITVSPCVADAVGQAFVQRPSGRLESVSHANRSIEKTQLAVITNNEEATSKNFPKPPQEPLAAWALLGAKTQLALRLAQNRYGLIMPR